MLLPVVHASGPIFARPRGRWREQLAALPAAPELPTGLLAEQPAKQLTEELAVQPLSFSLVFRVSLTTFQNVAQFVPSEILAEV